MISYLLFITAHQEYHPAGMVAGIMIAFFSIRAGDKNASCPILRTIVLRIASGIKRLGHFA
jgi:hypothetical protein